MTAPSAWRFPRGEFTTAISTSPPAQVLRKARSIPSLFMRRGSISTNSPPPLPLDPVGLGRQSLSSLSGRIPRQSEANVLGQILGWSSPDNSHLEAGTQQGLPRSPSVPSTSTRQVRRQRSRLALRSSLSSMSSSPSFVQSPTPPHFPFGEGVRFPSTSDRPVKTSHASHSNASRSTIFRVEPHRTPCQCDELKRRRSQ